MEHVLKTVVDIAMMLMYIPKCTFVLTGDLWHVNQVVEACSGFATSEFLEKHKPGVCVVEFTRK